MNPASGVDTRSKLRARSGEIRLRHWWLGVVASAFLLAPLSGCGYTAGGPFRTDVQTIYVEMFASKEFRRDLEFALTEAIKKRIATDTPYRLVAKEKADTILKGEVLQEEQAAFAPGVRTRQPRDKQLTLAVRTEWKDVRTGKTHTFPVVLQSADYLPAAPADEPEKFAQERAIDRLAARIVSQMYDEW